MKSNKLDTLKKCLFLAFLLVIITIVIAIIIKYDVEGEKSLPYSLKKIMIVSSISTSNNEDPENLWNINLNEYNDVFITIQKSEEGTKNSIKSITMNNFSINTKPKVGQPIIYRPTGDTKNDNLYEHSEENYLGKELTYEGAQTDTLKTLEIGNQGGIMGFRVSLNNIGTYISNNYDDEITYNGSLLTKTGITLDDLKFNLSFDIKITLDNDISYIGNNINMNFPSGDVINETKPYIELTDFNDIVFKREK